MQGAARVGCRGCVPGARCPPNDLPARPQPVRSWANQVLHVQKMLNNAPSTALGGMTRSEALFGAPDQTEKLPSAEAIINLLGFTK